MPAKAEDIGGELLSILSKGLYTNPLDCLREYVQNGVDAGARRIAIKVTGNMVSINDDGHGMDLEELVGARKVGLSPKSIADHVGFRGIGIYSGFDLCRELSISTTKKGSKARYVMVLKFAAMKSQLDQERAQRSGEHRSSLVELLSKYTDIELSDEPADGQSQGTLVTLQDVSPEHVARLSNEDDVQAYLLSNLPVDFADSFPYATVLRKRLIECVPGYRSVRVTLQLPNGKAERVERYARSDNQPFRLFEPKDIVLRDSADNPIAYVWTCLNTERANIDPKGTNDGSARYAGLIYKMKGFSIGTRDTLRTVFDSRPQIHNWYTGEVYVIDTKIVPNAERNDFETSAAKQVLEAELQKYVARQLIPDAVLFSDRSVAEKKVQEYKDQIEEFESDLKRDPVRSPLSQPEAKQKATRVLLNIIDDLPKRRKKLPPSSAYIALANELRERAKRVYSALDKQIRHPEETTKQRRTAQKPANSPSETEATAAEQQILTLNDVLKEAGHSLDDASVVIIDVIQAAIDDLLVPGSEAYTRFLTYVSERLAEQENGD
jgi:molecular chaperone HtpG